MQHREGKSKRTWGILELSSETGETKVATIHETENHRKESSRDLQWIALSLTNQHMYIRKIPRSGKEPLERIRWKKKKITAHRAKNTFCFHQAKWKNFLRNVAPSGILCSAAVLVLEKRPHTCVKLIFDKAVKVIQWDFSTINAGISRYPQEI